MKKIKKFNIQNIGSFLNFWWEDNLPNNKNKNGNIIENEFSSNNIFYGDNGNGKSTLVKIFKNINGNENIELKKHWNNESDEMKFELFDEDLKSFDLNSTEFKDKFVIFDKDFILKNVGDLSDKAKYQNENNKSRGDKIIALGGFVEKEKVLEKYNEIIIKLQGENQSFFDKIKLGGDKINSNLKNKNISDYLSNLEEINNQNIDFYQNEIKSKKERFKQLDELINNQSSLLGLECLSKIEKIIFDKSNFENAFKETFIGVDFQYQEKDLIKGLFEITKKEQIENCLFCKQKIKVGNYYINSIKNLFNTFSDIEKQISDKLEELKTIIFYLKQENKEIENLNTKNMLNFNILKKYESSFEYEGFKILLSRDFEDFLNDLLEEIKEKNNIKSNEKNINLDELNLFIIELNKSIEKFNKNVEKINEKINELKYGNTSTYTELKNILENEIIELENKYFIKNNFEAIQNYFEYNKKHELNKKNIEILSTKKDEYQRSFSEEFKKFSQEYGKYIGDILKELNSSLEIDFEIKNSNITNYSRGDSRYGFEIHYNNKNIIGDLSEGEKRSIALSYFFAEIKKKVEEKEILEEKRAKAIGKEIGEIDKKLNEFKNFFGSFLVLDDPAVDFDIGHKKVIANLITEYSSEFKQTFIFSHDSLFIDYLRNSFNNNKSGSIKNFWIYKTKGVSNITEFNKNVFDKYLEDLKTFEKNLTEDITELYVLTYKLRFCIEKVVKDEILGFDKTNCSGLIDHIGTSEKFQKVKSRTKDLNSIYNFCNNNGSHYSNVEGGNNCLSQNIGKFFEIYNLF